MYIPIMDSNGLQSHLYLNADKLTTQVNLNSFSHIQKVYVDKKSVQEKEL